MYCLEKVSKSPQLQSNIFESALGKKSCPDKELVWEGSERWDEWTSFGTCSSTCGGGKQDRTRQCKNGNVGDVGCQGNVTESQDCELQECRKFYRISIQILSESCNFKIISKSSMG